MSEANNFIFVYPNYRVNAFGFLPGAEIAADRKSDFNPGLLDQQESLIWTHKYIKQFGGDPTTVTIWGQSAGGGSVVAQVIASGGKTNPPLFSKALASSPSWPKKYRYNAPEAQNAYDTMAELSGCASKNSLACLKSVDVQTIRWTRTPAQTRHMKGRKKSKHGVVVGSIMKLGCIYSRYFAGRMCPETKSAHVSNNMEERVILLLSRRSLGRTLQLIRCSGNISRDVLVVAATLINSCILSFTS